MGSEFSEFDYSQAGEKVTDTNSAASRGASGGSIDRGLFGGIMSRLVDITKESYDLPAHKVSPYAEQDFRPWTSVGRQRKMINNDPSAGIYETFNADVYSEAAVNGLPLADNETSIASTDHYVFHEGGSYASFSLRLGSEGNVYYDLHTLSSLGDENADDKEVKAKAKGWGIPAIAFEADAEESIITQGILDDEHAHRFYNTLLDLGSKKNEDES